MKSITQLLFLVILLALSRPSFAMESDKLQHGIVSMALVPLFYQSLPKRLGDARAPLATLMTLAIGIGKELHDARVTGQPFDGGDMAANLGGTILGVYLIDLEF